MIIDKLKEEFLNCRVGQTVIPRLKAQRGSELYFHGITDPAKPFFLSSLIKPVNRTILFLANDINSALSIYFEVVNLTNLPVFYFPSQEVSPYDQISSDAEVISHQSRTILHLLNKNEPCLIISTAKCLLEKIWNKDDLKNNIFEINHDTKIEPQELANKLARLGYKKVQAATSRGEFSIRGDIFDIYPMCGDSSRIEFFGDEIEAIRTFLTTTQRSQENTNSILISPRFHVLDVENNISKLEEKILSIASNEELKEVARKDLEEIKTNPFSEIVEYYSLFLNQRNSSLFDYLSDDALIIVDDYESNAHLLKSWFDRNADIKNELEKKNKIIPLPVPLLHEKDSILSSLKKYSISYLAMFDVFESRNPESSVSLQTINLGLEPSLRFHNQIEKFIETTKEWIELNNKIVIFSDQPQRVKGVLKEWNISSLYTDEIRDGDFEKGHIFIAREGTVNGFKIPSAGLIILTDQEIFGTKRKATLLRKTSKSDKYDYYSSIEDLKPNDFVVHIKHGVGRYKGLVKVSLDNTSREYLLVEYASDGKLYLPVEQINLLYRYRGSGDSGPKLSKLGGADWELTKKKVKKAVKKVAEDLLNLYTARSKMEGHAFNPDTHWQVEMEEAFLYTETPDQWKAICDVKADMESTKPTDRLICGDVGFGKTEVAIRAIFKAVLSNKQVAVLVPTTILAQQHFNVISERLAPYPVRIGLLSRFVSPREQKNVIAKLTLGELDVVIGTHRLLQKDVMFKDLGLVVIDEEQRFGVIHKERLKQLRVTVDVITLSATPIPRTLHMALTGARDMSLINTPPTNRLPIKTFVQEFKPTIVKTAILHELERGGQVYFVHNRVESIYKTAAYIQELVPEAKTTIAHGQMNEKELESVMFDFSSKIFNVLVCTTIIESGLDIPNVNTIIVDNADQMGLAQLYQLRGRVGRSDLQAYAYCLYPEDRVLTETAKNRLMAIKEFSTLGSGYQIALRDMEIRGVGNVLGSEQHGHMISVGFDLYCQLLNEAVDKLRGLEVQDVELQAVVDLNISAYIPSVYIEDEHQKVIEYKRLSTVKNNRELEFITKEWKDRFGNYPEEVENLISIVELRLLANEIGIKYIKSEGGSSSNIKIDLNLRLDKWLLIQKRFPRSLIIRTAFKSSARGGADSSSFLLVKGSDMNAKQQLDLLFELVRNLKEYGINEKIA
jgi:transcription-repair coupling factor (superfamily II helicase)